MKQRPRFLRRHPPSATLAAALALGCGSKPETESPDRLDVGRADLVAIDVGTFQVGPTNRDSFDVEFYVDDNILSTVIVAAPTDEQVTVLTTELRDPNGELLLHVDTSDVEAVLPSLYNSRVRAYPFLGPGPFALLYPGSPEHELPPGRYHALYNVFGRAPKDVQFFTVQKRRPKGGGEPLAGRLPVTFWFAENEHVDAAAATTSNRRALPFLAALAELERIYASAGITLGPTSFRDLPAEPARRFSIVDGDEFSELFASVDTSSAPGLNFFLVEALELNAGGGVVVGLANGIPGPPALPGLPGGGVVVSLINLEFNPKLVGQVMAHEGGHYLGLMHTTERDGTLFDLLDDTPQCDASSYDLDASDSVEVGECAAEGGADNLMFWSADASPEQVTADQRYVLLRNPTIDTSGAE